MTEQQVSRERIESGREMSDETLAELKARVAQPQFTEGDVALYRPLNKYVRVRQVIGAGHYAVGTGPEDTWISAKETDLEKLAAISEVSS